jgi:hypothetical protein
MSSCFCCSSTTTVVVFAPPHSSDPSPSASPRGIESVTLSLTTPAVAVPHVPTSADPPAVPAMNRSSLHSAVLAVKARLPASLPSIKEEEVKVPPAQVPPVSSAPLPIAKPASPLLASATISHGPPPAPRIGPLSVQVLMVRDSPRD